MKYLKISLWLIAIVTFSACTSTSKITDISNKSTTLEKNKIIYIAPVSDGAYSGKVYTGSGQSVTTYLLQYLNPYANNVVASREKGDFFADARSQKADYILTATIKNWEPRAAAWSGIPTKVEILISVVDTQSNKELVSKLLSIKGRSFTMVNQSAEGLAEYLIREYCSELFE